MHETSDDVRVEIGPDGVANIEHHLRYRIVAGHFKQIDLVGIDPRAELSPEAILKPEKGNSAEVLGRVEPVPKTPGTVRILIDEGKGLTRGAYVVDVKYRLDLVATKMLARDGAMWKVSWTAPPAPEGHDGARVIFDLPAAPTEPRLAAALESTTTLSTLRRGPERDELELVRAHVPRGEAVTWRARVDPKAFPRVVDPELRPPPPPEVQPTSVLGSNLSRVLAGAGFALLAGLLAFLLREKQKMVRAAVATRSLRARPMIDLPRGATPFAYGIVSASALATLLWSNPIAGALLVTLAMALAAHRAPAAIVRPRGPGAWQPLSETKALLPQAPSPLPSDALDIGATRGRVTFLLVIAALGALTFVLRFRVPQIAIALPLVAMAIVPIFVTGTRAQLAPTPIDLAARLLRPARDALAKMIDLAHVDLRAIGRVVTDKRSGSASSSNIDLARVDEVRLAAAPRDRIPGLRAIELALAPSGDAFAAPEVFVRYDEGSAAAARIASLCAGIPIVCGRVPEERVIRLVPEEPTPRAAAALVAKMLDALEGRRLGDRVASAAETDPAAPASRPILWRGPERRRPRKPATSGPSAKPVTTAVLAPAMC